jgi:hypothetical protein
VKIRDVAVKIIFKRIFGEAANQFFFVAYRVYNTPLTPQVWKDPCVTLREIGISI